MARIVVAIDERGRRWKLTEAEAAARGCEVVDADAKKRTAPNKARSSATAKTK